jgi:DNA processing protein
MRRCITPGQPGWPTQLDELGSGCPRKLYIDGGEIPGLEDCLGIVGTRRASAAGITLARSFGRRFAEAGFTVVSGMARGIDTAAHRGALDVRGKTIAVVGCGLDLTYPSRNEALKRSISASGAVVSEYPDGTEPLWFHFPERNRIIAGLCKGVVVIEGGERSGALITARFALDSNREVWAIPGSPHDPRAAGPNSLIRAGEAGLITHPDQIFDLIAPEVAWKGPYEMRRSAPLDLSDEELEVLAALSAVPVSADELCGVVALPPGRLALALAKLEVRGFARRSTGGSYQISEAGGRVLGVAIQG